VSVVLAIVGSTQFDRDPQASAIAEHHIVEAIVRLQPERVVSGGARGIDSLAAQIARAYRIPVTEHLPEHPRWAPRGYKERNMRIATDCTHLLRITHPRSTTYGSGWTADRAEEMGRIVERITIEGL